MRGGSINRVTGVNPQPAGGQFGQYKMYERLLTTWHMGAHLRVLSEIFPMNTNMAVSQLEAFQKALRSCALDESNLSNGRVKDNPTLLAIIIHLGIHLLILHLCWITLRYIHTNCSTPQPANKRDCYYNMWN